ncbi:MAG: UDP-N-acetylglucosamine 2-epimerase (non-hydrolyzing), partial [candidate division Zixibacteria bacterium]|nr:UDP-N-acetylglucosamine 2-epimerase (non-hydrolyzing) [candidate division Zixibacteria bacterium]
MLTVLTIMGTRPEIIKMAPVVKQLDLYNDIASVTLATRQHREMADQMFQEFNITPDIDLDIMIPNQTLGYLTSKIASEMEKVFEDHRPDVLLVQGDTTSACIAALTAFYHRIPVGHVEAGLRTYDPNFPFPEEINRQIISRVSRFNFAPTQRARENMLGEGIDP